MWRKCVLHNLVFLAIIVFLVWCDVKVIDFISFDVLRLGSLLVPRVVGFLIYCLLFFCVMRRFCCVHEAGHAVMFLLQGCELEVITTTFVVPIFPPSGFDNRKEIKGLLAGVAAEKLFRCNLAWFGSQNDLRMAYKAAKRHLESMGVSHTQRYIESLLKILLDETMRELSREKDAIALLADTLHRRWRLDGGEVQRIFSPES